LIKRRIETGEEKGEIFPGSTEETSIAFNDSADLHFALHGVKK